MVASVRTVGLFRSHRDRRAGEGVRDERLITMGDHDLAVDYGDHVRGPVVGTTVAVMRTVHGANAARLALPGMSEV